MLYQRIILSDIKRWLKQPEIIVLNGPRQVGKTSILQLLKNDLESQAAAETVFYLNLEEIKVLEPLNENPENLLNYITEHKKKNYFLIDEIQYLDKPSNFLKHLYDKYNKKIKIICTGSSSLELKAKFQDSLAGRKISFNILPLSFEEFLIFTTQGRKNKFYEYFKKKEIPAEIGLEFKKLLDEYLLYGGLPAVVLKKDKNFKRELLNEYVNTYINKDIRYIGKIEDILKFNQLVKLLAAQLGCLLNVNEIANTLNLPRRKVEEYVNLLENTFVLIKLRPYFKNIRSQISKMPKFYWFDLGIRNQILDNFTNLNSRTDAGALFENFIFNELRQKRVYNLSFYRTTTKSEIDFIVEKNNELQPLEVKYQNLSKIINTKALVDFGKNLKTIKGKVINLNYNYQDKLVDYEDYRRFLLNNYTDPK